MFNRAVTAFRKSMQKSRSSSNLESDGDEVESVASSFSSYSMASGRSDAPSSTGSASFMGARRRFRRSRSTNREGEWNVSLFLLNVRDNRHKTDAQRTWKQQMSMFM